jgi:dTDP-4-dehydrorhamnose 3,5-epimerase
VQFDPLEIDGAFLIRTELVADERGGFARTFCAGEFAAKGLVDRFTQHSVSFNSRRGTVRGLHFQAKPFGETKVVRCIRGVVFDVIIDLRPQSSTFGKWCATRLLADERNAVYVPKGCAHGYQTLLDDCELEYLITPAFAAPSVRGIRWDDPTLAIEWPITEGVIMSSRDQELPLFEPSRLNNQKGDV